MNMKNLKRRLGLWAEHGSLLGKIAKDINFMLFHWDKRQQDKSFGSLNPSVKFYVLRSDGKLEGLLSLYLRQLRNIYSCLQNGFVPIIDYKNYKTQYNINAPVNGTLNAWEYYFEQPCSYTLDEVYQSQNVRLSGWRFMQSILPPPPKA